MIECGAAYPPLILENGEIYRLFTCMFLHFGIEHLLNNMLVLFVLGSRLEQAIGKIKFLLIYLIGGVLGNVISLLIELRSRILLYQQEHPERCLQLWEHDLYCHPQ